jgi:hypothetical protein
MRRFLFPSFSLLLIIAFVWWGWAGASAPAEVFPAATPSDFAYLPYIAKQPTSTPTPTPAATLPSGSGLAGSLALCNPAQTTYPVGSDVCVIETIQNHNPFTVNYSILGVAVRGPENGFQTSWGGSLSIGPGCTGPVDTCGGPWQDNVRGPNNQHFTAPGSYTLALSICFSSYSACQQPGANWQEFSPGIAITISN